MERPFPAYRGPDPYIFVSYAHEDAGTVYPELVKLKESGFNIWYDEGISPGSTWRDEVALALTQCSIFLFFITPRSVVSQNCLQELNFSLTRERKVLAVHLENTALPPGIELSLSDKQAIMRAHYAGDAFTQKLTESLQASLPSAVEPVSILKQEPVTKADVDEKSIAVLPLENRSSDPENEYLSDGIAEEIIGDLSRVKGLRVASEIASFAMKGLSLDLKTMGEKLGVNTLLSGSVRKQGKRVRINVLLTRVEDGSTLWSERYDGEMDDIFELQDAVVRQVVDALKVELGTAEVETNEQGARNVEAYNEFLMGSFETRKHEVRSYHRALAHLERAVAIDPDYLDAYPRIIYTCWWLGQMEGDPEGKFTEVASSALEEMARLDPQKSHVAWAQSEDLIYWMTTPFAQRNAAVDGELRAREIIENSTDYHANYVAAAYVSYADLCRGIGLYHAVLEFMERANVMGAKWLYLQAQACAALGRFDRAIEYCDEELRVNPSNAPVQSDRSIWLSRTGQFEKAQHDVNRLNENWGPRHFPAFCLHYWRGDTDKATSDFEWLRERKRFDPYYKGACSIMLGDLNAGLDYFQEAFDTQSGVVPIMRVLNDTYLTPSQLDALYARDRYQEILRRLFCHDDDARSCADRMNGVKHITGVEVRFGD